MDLNELRQLAKEKGIDRYWQKSEETLIKELDLSEDSTEIINDEPVEIQESAIKIASIQESEDLQRNGWRVFAIEVIDNKMIHKLKRVSVG